MLRRGSSADLLVVGLGNPGREYQSSRHNVGFDVVDELASRHQARLRKGRERALVAEVRIAERRVTLAKPQTFMNLSGESVGRLVRRFGIEDLTDLVVVHDELDLPLGRVRVKQGGGLAGHNGLRSITAHLHSQDYSRVRIGVGKPPTPERGADHVLRRPGKAERTELDVAVQLASDAVEAIAEGGVQAAMSDFNGR